MKRFRRKRKSLVRWLPDKSSFENFSFQRIPAGGIATPVVKFDLLAEAGGFPSSLDYSSGQINTARYNSNLENLIVDRITGKVNWSLTSNGGTEGDSDAAGNWYYIIRSAIVLVGTAPEDGPATPVNPSYAGVDIRNSLDPGANAFTPFQDGSLTPDGFRILWRRNWFLYVDWRAGGNATGTLLNAEDACPPGPYLEVKPKRLLKATEQIQLLCQCSAFMGPGNGAGSSGTSGIVWSPDLRVAAHNTARRR